MAFLHSVSATWVRPSEGLPGVLFQPIGLQRSEQLYSDHSETRGGNFSLYKQASLWLVECAFQGRQKTVWPLAGAGRPKMSPGSRAVQMGAEQEQIMVELSCLAEEGPGPRAAWPQAAWPRGSLAAVWFHSRAVALPQQQRCFCSYAV